MNGKMWCFLLLAVAMETQSFEIYNNPYLSNKYDVNTIKLFTQQRYYEVDAKCVTNCTHKSYKTSDILHETGKVNIYFPKCCEPNFFYHPKQHKCIYVNGTTEIYDDEDFHVRIVKFGLENCKVITDHVIDNRTFKQAVNVEQNNTVVYNNKSYSLGTYCFDKTYNSTSYILRTCETMDVCTADDSNGKRPLCIKKCCPDGTFYIKDNCTYNNTSGLDISQYSDLISNFTGKIV